MLHKDRKKPRKPKRNTEKKVQVNNTTLGAWSRTLYLLTVSPTPVNCHSPFCTGTLQEKKPTMQNYHDTKFQRCKSPIALKCRDDKKYDLNVIQREGNYSFIWHHTLWANWMSLWIHLNLQGGRSNKPAGQRSLKCLSQLPLKISIDRQPLSTGQRWRNNLVMIMSGSTISCISAALVKERILTTLSMWHHHTHYQP